MAVIKKKKQEKPKRLKAVDVELAVVNYFNPRTCLIVPNVWWGMFDHECDLLIVTKAGFAWEIEIKVSVADLKLDKNKRHGHLDKKIKDLYFAMPDYMESHIEHVPAHAGIILVKQNRQCTMLRKPKSAPKPYKFTDEDRFRVARLGALRIWGLKKKLMKRDIEEGSVKL